MLGKTVTDSLIFHFDRPLYAAACVLELSKHWMAFFWFTGLRKVFETPPTSRIFLNMSDTDSFVVSVRTPPGTDATLMWKRFADLSNFIDFASFEIEHPVFTCWDETIESERCVKQRLLELRTINKGRLGLFKNELFEVGKGETGTTDQSIPLIREAVCLRPKLYSLDIAMTNTTHDVQSDLSIRRAKGVSRRTVTNFIRHDSYLKCLRTAMPQRHRMTNIRSLNQQIYIAHITKKSLSSFCTKRWWYAPSHSWPLRNSSLPGSLRKVKFYEDQDVFDHQNDNVSDVETV